MGKKNYCSQEKWSEKWYSGIVAIVFVGGGGDGDGNVFHVVAKMALKNMKNNE